jgi:hypothetical protein
MILELDAQDRPGACRSAVTALRTVVGLALAGLLVSPLAASASTYYVSVGGNDANAGTSSGAPWATIAKANSTLRAGDVCVVMPGTYSTTIKPVASGTLLSRITYVGSITNPGAVVVPPGARRFPGAN